MDTDQFIDQLPDPDPSETAEWLDSLDAVVDAAGATRAEYLVARINEHARERSIGTPAAISTPYINTIPDESQPCLPGDLVMERRIRQYLRWNAAATVVRANLRTDGIGGHLSTFASSAMLYEVGLNHFFRGKDSGRIGDHVYFQGHASAGIYARAFLEHRLDEEHLINFRHETDGHGLSSYPHPWLMPEFWEFPTVSMGLGPINSIYQARFHKYLHNRRIEDTSASRVWCFVGDGETDEPETLGSISLAGREQLDNLIWVVNCNLQRLDGPVRGNGKIIQELESVFRGAGWNVIKVIWGEAWDELLARDVDGVLLAKMNATVDGEWQRCAVESGAYIREHFFGPDPRLRQLVEHLTDEQLQSLPRGGHDYRKVYAAYQAATETQGAPTVILAKTVKGWALGSAVESRNATHQIKKMSVDQLKDLRDRLGLHEQLPDSAFEGGNVPFYRPPVDSPEHLYLMNCRRALDGLLPKRLVVNRRPLALPPASAFEEFHTGSGTHAVSTTMAFTRILRTLCRDPQFGSRVVPIIPDEGRTFGVDALFRELKIYASQGQKYEPVDAAMLHAYIESTDGQILEEGITEAGSMASFTAAGTAYANFGVPMVPFFILYSMFGFQRVGDLIWAAADARTKGFIIGATAGRTTLFGEGLQHQDGHSLVLASTVPTCQAYDPAFAYELAAIIEVGLQRMYGGPDNSGDSVFYYIAAYNENYEMPARPEHVSIDDVLSGLYRWNDSPVADPKATIVFSGTAQAAAREAQIALAQRGIGVELWSATSYKRLRENALDVERWNRLHPLETRRVSDVAAKLGSAPGPIIAVTDFMKSVPDQIARFVPKDFIPLGTDGFGRSDTRAELRRFFETDANHIEIAVLSALAAEGSIEASVVSDAISAHGIDVEAIDPRER
jgi:pyruvate dehydrogenase E1 component